MKRASVPGQQFEWVPQHLNTKQDHFPFALQLWTERDISMGRVLGEGGLEKEFVVPERTDISAC